MTMQTDTKDGANMSKREIRFTPESTGNLMLEVIRAYSGSALPSCLLKKVSAGMRLGASETGNATDAALMLEVADEIERLSIMVRAKEDELYR